MGGVQATAPRFGGILIGLRSLPLEDRAIAVARPLA
jgi:hypothetical protein